MILSSKKCLICDQDFLGPKKQKYCKNSCNRKAYVLRHPDRVKQAKLKWSSANSDHLKQYNLRNRKRLSLNKKIRYAEDLEFRLRENLRTRLSKAIKRNQKAGSAVSDLGCSIDELKTHLESKFQPGMSWDNYGEWEIDHMTPLTSFSLQIREELIKACHFTNLQPLWKDQNKTKGGK
jgi:hypothetical protein